MKDEIKHPQTVTFLLQINRLGIGVEANATSIGITASSLSVRYRSILVPDLGTLIPKFRHYKKIAQRYNQYCR